MIEKGRVWRSGWRCHCGISTRICSLTSTGVVLLCNIIPSLCVKTLCPFVMHRIPYWCVVSLYWFLLSLMITAFSESVYVALCGVCLASFSSGLGETTYLGLAGHYSKNTIATWSSGTGMAGIISSFSYAGLTDRRLLALSPAQTMLVMLVVPVIFMFTLLRYMIPLSLTYFAEYLINQGLLELTVFDCKNGFGTSPASQYRWYQVLYQVGVFVSPPFFMFNAIYAFVPNFAIVCVIVFYEGLIGGGSYVNTFHHIHKKVDPSTREFALSTVSLADSFGILLAALVSIPVHNAICAMQWYHA
uniref:Battenin n=1 Tax=Angiostrongylus cantonensis TaxID=6313 RepID=A0A0K0CSU5_ANGCA